MSNSIAFITGITGQTGSYLAEYLLHKGYTVHGLVRRSSSFNTERIDHIFNKLNLHFGDLSDGGRLSGLISDIRPSEIYNMAAQSHVKVSFDMPEYTGDIDGLGVTRILETIRMDKILKYTTKIYQASSSELFGNSLPPQSESTAMLPASPYACAKLYAYNMAKNYRDAYGMFVSNGILFNHTSPRRGATFVTRKITKFVASLLYGNKNILRLGNLNSKRDWGFAPDYVECIYKLLQQDNPLNLVVGTGQSIPVREFVELAFKYVGLPIIWEGSGENEVGKIYGNKTVIKIDPIYFRPNEVNSLCANPFLAKTLLKWEPKVNYEEIVKIMIDYELVKVGLPPIGEGYSIATKRFPWTTIK